MLRKIIFISFPDSYKYRYDKLLNFKSNLHVPKSSKHPKIPCAHSAIIKSFLKLQAYVQKRITDYDYTYNLFGPDET